MSSGKNSGLNTVDYLELTLININEMMVNLLGKPETIFLKKNIMKNLISCAVANVCITGFGCTNKGRQNSV
jgi:hypothetical protein